ncbi:MAG: hypothetical protein JW841_18735 [Deltaproteobacteria bacterium]|nr:hypothetical protein [Deltaproteobacteria bacterium]
MAFNIDSIPEIEPTSGYSSEDQIAKKPQKKKNILCHLPDIIEKAGSALHFFKKYSAKTAEREVIPRPVQVFNSWEIANRLKNINDPTTALKPIITVSSPPASEGSNRVLEAVFIHENNPVLAQLDQIGNQLDFKTKKFIRKTLVLEDNFIMLEDKTILLPYYDYQCRYINGKQYPRWFMEHFLSLIGNMNSYLSILNHYDINVDPVTDEIKPNLQGNTLSLNHAHAIEVTQFGENRKFRVSRVYLEGGNVLTTEKSDGSKGIIIGEHSVIGSLIALEWQDHFIDEKNKEFSKIKIENKIKQLNILPIEIAYIKNILLESGRMAMGKDSPPFEQQTKEFIAKLELTKDVIAEELSVKRSDISFIPQIGFHIDMYMRPGPNGQIFINDEKESIKTLDLILENKKYEGFDQLCLAKYREKAKKLTAIDIADYNADVSKSPEVAKARKEAYLWQFMMQQINEILQRDNYVVRPIAGSFGADLINQSDYRRVNLFISFLNSLTGEVENGKYFYITCSSSIKELDNAFAAKISSYGIDKDLIFFLDDPTRKIILSRTLLDCSTIEELKSNIEASK